MDTLKIILITTMLVLFTVVIAILISIKIYRKRGEALDLTKQELDKKADEVLASRKESPLDDEDKEIIKGYYNSETVKNNNYNPSTDPYKAKYGEDAKSAGGD